MYYHHQAGSLVPLAKRYYRQFIIAFVGLFFATIAATTIGVSAATDCTFTDVGMTRYLDASCTTDSTIEVPNGFTLDGGGNTITAIDPVGDHFKGAIVKNAGAVAHITNLNVTAELTLNACDGGDDRLRGIMLEGASGSVTHANVYHVVQEDSGCQEGNSIEIINAPFNGTHPNTQKVLVEHNEVSEFMKTGIVASGDVDVAINHNKVGESANQDDLAANGIQVGFGAKGEVSNNQIDGNQWKGASDYAATAVLLYLSEGVLVENNKIRGNSDIAIYEYGNSTEIVNNKVFDEGTDHANSGYDYGIGLWGNDSSATKNKVKGFDNNYVGVTGGKNVTIPGPQKGSPAF